MPSSAGMTTRRAPGRSPIAWPFRPRAPSPIAPAASGPRCSTWCGSTPARCGSNTGAGWRTGASSAPPTTSPSRGRRTAPRQSERPVMPDVADRLLAGRLAGLGMPPYRGVVTHTNRMVMLSVTPGGILRIHRGYAHAPDRVLKAIVRFLKRGTRRAARREAEREFLAFPVEKYAPPTRPARRIERPRPGDAVLLLRLEETHRRLNAQHFSGRLRGIRFRL